MWNTPKVWQLVHYTLPHRYGDHCLARIIHVNRNSVDLLIMPDHDPRLPDYFCSYCVPYGRRLEEATWHPINEIALAQVRWRAA